MAALRTREWQQLTASRMPAAGSDAAGGQRRRAAEGSALPKARIARVYARAYAKGETAIEHKENMCRQRCPEGRTT
jgi:hypothetical protein